MAAPTQEEYFADGFDANSLRVPQLRSILVEHGIATPAVARKADLVELFEDKVLPKGNKLLVKARNVKASARGIVAVSENGDETPVEPPKRRGRPRKTTTEEPEVEPATKRSRQSTRLSKTPAPTEPDDAPITPLPSVPSLPDLAELPEPQVKKKGKGRAKEVEGDDGDTAGIEDGPEKVSAVKAPRKSRARQTTTASSPEAPPVPSVPSSSRRTIPANATPPIVTPTHDDKPKSILKKEPSVPVVTDHEDEQDVPRSTPSKRKAKTPRRSDEDESGFSDANPFQSGSEEAARKEIRRRRKSSMGPHRDLGAPIEAIKATPRRSEPAPFSFTPGTLRRVGPSTENLKSPPSAIRQQIMQERELDAAEKYNQVVQEKLSHIESTPSQITVTSPTRIVQSNSHDNLALVRRGTNAIQRNPRVKQSIPLATLGLLLLLLLGNWTSDSRPLGYCDTGRDTNDVILGREANRLEMDHKMQMCRAQQAAIRDQQGQEQEQDDEHAHQLTVSPDCNDTELPLIPFLPHPSACTPCPQHAQCEEGRLVACDNEYILSPSPLGVLSPLLDGFPGLGPRAFPPSCRPDTAKKRMIGSLAQEVEAYLARGRGRVECARLRLGNGDGRTGEGERYGVQEGTVREVFEARRDPKFSQEQFEEVWEAALRDLLEHQDIVESIDIHGVSWYAAKRSDMTLGCRAKTQAYQSLDEWKAQLASTAAVIAAILAAQRSFKGRRAEKYRAEELADVVLRRLQDQEHLHHADPTTNPASYLPPAQVRDLVLPHKGSVASRSRTWKRVEQLVERNANVATREKEVAGEMWRTWEWTGPVKRGELGVESSPARIKF